MQNIEQKFEQAYKGRTIKEASRLLDIPEWKGYELKQKLGLKVERWQRAGMPPRFSDHVKEILFGTLLGDGAICKAGNCKYRKLEINHSPKQKKYLNWLRTELLELRPSKITNTNDKWGTLGFYTPPHPQFDEIYQICYPDTKQITNQWLQELTPLSIAVWYMDDGGSQDCYNIATCSFSIKSCEMIKEFMITKWSIEPTIRNTDYPRLSFNKINTIKLRNLIENHIIPSMKYKLELKPYNSEERKQKYLRKVSVNASIQSGR